MLETREKVIGSHTYYVRQLGAGEATALLVRLTKALGPVLGALLEDMGGVSADQVVNITKLSEVKLESVSKALEALARQVNLEDLTYVRRVLGDATQVSLGDGRMVPLNMETQELHFRGGRLGVMFRWLGFALEVQFSDFFPATASASASSASAPVAKGTGS